MGSADRCLSHVRKIAAPRDRGIVFENPTVISGMIVLYTDFGSDDIYVGQVKSVLLGQLGRPETIVDLTHAVPPFDVAAGAHLLAALQARFPRGTVFLAVVDPGVGTDRDAAVM
jgi:S-adenosylmethionine hydrolase